MKKFLIGMLSVAMSAALTAGLVACGGGETSVEDSTDTGDSVNEPVDTRVTPNGMIPGVTFDVTNLSDKTVAEVVEELVENAKESGRAVDFTVTKTNKSNGEEMSKTVYTAKGCFDENGEANFDIKKVEYETDYVYDEETDDVIAVPGGQEHGTELYVRGDVAYVGNYYVYDGEKVYSQDYVGYDGEYHDFGLVPVYGGDLDLSAIEIFRQLFADKMTGVEYDMPEMYAFNETKDGSYLLSATLDVKQPVETALRAFGAAGDLNAVEWLDSLTGGKASEVLDLLVKESGEEGEEVVEIDYNALLQEVVNALGFESVDAIYAALEEAYPFENVAKYLAKAGVVGRTQYDQFLKDGYKGLIGQLLEYVKEKMTEMKDADGEEAVVVIEDDSVGEGENGENEVGEEQPAEPENSLIPANLTETLAAYGEKLKEIFANIKNMTVCEVVQALLPQGGMINADLIFDMLSNITVSKLGAKLDVKLKGASVAFSVLTFVSIKSGDMPMSDIESSIRGNAVVVSDVELVDVATLGDVAPKLAATADIVGFDIDTDDLLNNDVLISEVLGVNKEYEIVTEEYTEPVYLGYRYMYDDENEREYFAKAVVDENGVPVRDDNDELIFEEISAEDLEKARAIIEKEYVEEFYGKAQSLVLSSVMTITETGANVNFDNKDNYPIDSEIGENFEITLGEKVAKLDEVVGKEENYVFEEPFEFYVTVTVKGENGADISVSLNVKASKIVVVWDADYFINK